MVAICTARMNRVKRFIYVVIQAQGMNGVNEFLFGLIYSL